MMSIIIFNISGLAILLLIITKKMEEKRRKPLFISNAISRGDIHVRKLYHTVIHLYSEMKEKGLFFLKKQIPIHSKNSLNKIFSFLREKRGQYINNMRDSRLLKKPGGMSEFLRNMSDVEKGNGVIHDAYEDTSPNDRSVGRDSQNVEEKVE